MGAKNFCDLPYQRLHMIENEFQAQYCLWVYVSNPNIAYNKFLCRFIKIKLYTLHIILIIKNIHLDLHFKHDNVDKLVNTFFNYCCIIWIFFFF